jgi:Fic family protein
MLVVHHYLQRHPVTSAKNVVANCDVTLPTANSALSRLEEMGIVKEVTGKVRNKIYVYQKYLNTLSEGTSL